MNYNRKSTIRFIKCITTVVLILVGLTYLVNKITYSNAEESVKTEIKAVTEAAVVTEEPIQEIIRNDMPQYNISLSQELQEHTWNQCNYMEIPYELELAVLYIESEFNEKAVNYNSTCRGMGQLSRQTGERVANVLQIDNFWDKDVNNTKQKVFDAECNIDCSVYHLWELKQIGISRYYSDEDNYLFILGAYNYGVAGFDNYVREHDTMETDYADEVSKVKSDLEQYGTIK